MADLINVPCYHGPEFVVKYGSRLTAMFSELMNKQVQICTECHKPHIPDDPKKYICAECMTIPHHACAGTARSGEKCRAMIRTTDTYCASHIGQAPREPAVAPVKPLLNPEPASQPITPRPIRSALAPTRYTTENSRGYQAPD